MTKFLINKFKRTNKEEDRPDMEDIPEYRDTDADLARKEFDVTVVKLTNHKAVGPDGIPIESMKCSPLVKQLSFEIVSKMWKEESLPEV